MGSTHSSFKTFTHPGARIKHAHTVASPRNIAFHTSPPCFTHEHTQIYTCSMKPCIFARPQIFGFRPVQRFLSGTMAPVSFHAALPQPWYRVVIYCFPHAHTLVPYHETNAPVSHTPFCRIAQKTTLPSFTTPSLPQNAACLVILSLASTSGFEMGIRNVVYRIFKSMRQFHNNYPIRRFCLVF